MRTLTKTGIRILSAKYRSILIKCAIINASVFIGMVGGVQNAMAADMTWAQLKSAIETDSAKTINITNDITSAILGESGNITISREVSIVGDSGGRYLSGNKTHSGFKIDTNGVLTLENITMQNFNNTASGGAIQNQVTISSITGDFIGNKSSDKSGGAIYNTGTITSITGNFKYNSAKNNGGAVWNGLNKKINFVTEKDKNITFDGNYVTSETGKGGAIYNGGGTVGLYAVNAEDKIEFTGTMPTDIPDGVTPTDVDGINNQGTLNINGNETDTYAGAVNLQNVTGDYGTTNIYGGNVNVKDTFIQKDLNLYAGTLNLGKGGNVTNLNANGGALSMSIPYGTFDNYTNEISTLSVDKFTGTLNNFTVDFKPGSSNAPLACMDKISINAIEGEGTPAIHLTAVNVLGNSELPPLDVVTATYLTGDGKDSILTTETENIKTAIDGSIYTFTFDGAGKGNVKVTMEANGMDLPTAIQTDDETITGYSAQVNPVIIYGDLGTLVGENRNFTIFGNGSTIDGNGYAGITVEEGQTLTLNNADMKHFTKETSDMMGQANGGAINNEGTITDIIGDFDSNFIMASGIGSQANGGAIYNKGIIGDTTAHTGGIKGNFVSNSANQDFPTAVSAGGAIYNETAGTIENIEGDFISNHSHNNGGAIYNKGKINSIKGNLTSNYSSIGGGGVIYNETAGTIENIEGDFISNHASTGGALYNKGKINSITSSFIANYAADNSGGAIRNDTGATLNIVTKNGELKFDGNYLKSSFNNGGAIYNAGTVGLYAVNETDKITFTGSDEQIPDADKASAKAIDDIYNTGTLNINGDGNGVTYAGTVNLYTVSDINSGPHGTTNIYGGTVNVVGSFVQNNINVKNGATLMLSANTVAASATMPLANSVFTLDNSTLNLQNNSTGTVYLGGMRLVGSNNLMLDADLANEQMDQLNVTSVSGSGNIVISDIKLLSDANDDYMELSLFADGTTTDVYNKVSGNLNGLAYSSTYKYDALYDSATGKIGFTRYNSGTSDDFNPYIYTPSVVANTTVAMTTQIATLAMDKMDDVVHAQGRSGGDTTKSSNAWVKVMGLNDNVEFKNFENVDSKALTVVGGYNTDKITWADNSVVFGAYAGYIGGKQQYTANDIDQDGGYVGLSSALTLGDAFLTATVNGGLLKNKANNMYGSDRFNTLWLGAGLKTGYNFAITDSVVLQPNVYGGYTLVNTKDYTSVSGVKIATNNLNFFEVDPGLKLSAVIADGWTGSVQGKYAIVMDNGADITANDIALQNISTKNYIEYGIGIDKSLTDAFYLGAKVNRHDGGRTGWNGSIEFRYKF